MVYNCTVEFNKFTQKTPLLNLYLCLGQTAGDFTVYRAVLVLRFELSQYYLAQRGALQQALDFCNIHFSLRNPNVVM